MPHNTDEKRRAWRKDWEVRNRTLITEKQRQRRMQRYVGECETCGEPTDGSNGRAKAPRFCYRHVGAANSPWSRTTILRAIQRWASERGRQPSASDWRATGGTYPVTATVQQHFGSWSKAIAAAGFSPLRAGHYIDESKRRRKAA